MQIENKYLTINPYSRPGNKIGTIKGIVVHWVGNAGSNAIANRNYFEGLKIGKKNTRGNFIYASSHYIVGLEGEIIACVPEEEIAYHASKANKDHIGIEVCHPDSSGKFSAQTYEVLITLILDICKQYQLDPLRHVIRHYDVTGKECPMYYVKQLDAWQALRQEVNDKMLLTEIPIRINGKMKVVDAINIKGYTYVKLRDLADQHIKIDYDVKEKLPIINIKR